MVEPSLALTDEPLAASYHLRPAFDLAFAGLIGLPDERFAVRGAQAADWNRAICTNALREALRRYARAPAVSAALDVAAMDAALDRWRTGILLGDEEEVAPANDLPTAFSLASFLFVHTE